MVTFICFPVKSIWYYPKLRTEFWYWNTSVRWINFQVRQRQSFEAHSRLQLVLALIEYDLGWIHKNEVNNDYYDLVVEIDDLIMKQSEKGWDHCRFEGS